MRYVYNKRQSFGKKIINIGVSLALIFSSFGLSLPFFISQNVSASVSAASSVNEYVTPTGSDSGDCSTLANACSIQYAINNANNNLTGGTIINLAQGNYDVGPISINKNMTIVGVGRSNTIIKATQNTGNSGDSRGWFVVNSGVNFTLQSVTLDGSGYQIYQALRVDGSAVINDVAFQNITYPGYLGFGVVFFGGGPGNTVTNSTFNNIGREGVLVYGPGTAATLSGNTYTGKGTGDWLDYAFEVGNGAQATITSNTISDNQGIASSDQSTSAGILVTTYYGSGTVATITGNTITNSTDGIAVGYDQSDTSKVVVHDNNLSSDLHGVNSTAPIVDATDNWWGDASGPLDQNANDGSQPTSNQGGLGSAAIGPVKYAPWYTNEAMTSTQPVPPTNMRFLNGNKPLTCGSGLSTNVTNNLQFVWSDPVGTTIAHRTVMTYPDGTSKTAYTGSLNLWIGNQSKYGYDNGFAEHGQGIYSYAVEDENAANQWSSPAPACTLIYETSIPTANLNMPLPTSVNKNFQVSATASDNVMLQNVFFDVRSKDGSKWVSGCIGGTLNLSYSNGQKNATLNCTINTSPLVNGTTYLLRVHASNYAGYGNVNNASQVFFTYDTTPPNTPTNLSMKNSNGKQIGSGDATNSNNVTAVWTDSSTDVNHYNYMYWNNIPGSQYNSKNHAWETSVSNTEYSGVFNQGEGANYFEVQAVDAAGNVSDWSTPFQVIYDKTAPTVTVDTPGSTSNTEPLLSGTINDPTAAVQVSLDNGVTYQPAVISNGTWSYQVSSPLSTGIYNIEVMATDPAGNSSSVKAALSITPPLILSLATPTPTPTPTLNSVSIATTPITPLTTANANISTPTTTSTSTGHVLGATTTSPNTSSSNVKGDHTTTPSTKKSSNWLELGWWWLLVVAAILVLLYAWWRHQRLANQSLDA